VDRKAKSYMKRTNPQALRWTGDLGSCNLARTPDYITSTPKSDHFPKKWPKTPKNERASCIPLPKNGERPYLAPSKTLFRGPILALFCGVLLPISAQSILFLTTFLHQHHINKVSCNPKPPLSPTPIIQTTQKINR